MPKTTVETLKQISISSLKRQGYFKFGTAPLLQNLTLTTTNCYFGGKRFWFLCICGKRVGIMYSDTNKFKCRQCLNLTYQSQNDKHSTRNDFILNAADNFIKALELAEKMKRFTYAGNPTKKAQKLAKLYSSSILTSME